MPPQGAKKQRWYLGGVAGSGAVCVTHPLDLIKVHLQIQKKNRNVLQLIQNNAARWGILSFYSGLSASITRQMTYSTARFGVYESLQNLHRERGEVAPFHRRLLYAGLGGVCGAFVGNFADVINVRMQWDIKQPEGERYKYRNVVDGAVRIVKSEGVAALFRGVGPNMGRAALMNIGQAAFYDQTKDTLLQWEVIGDNTAGHFTCSFVAGTAATVITQPFDVVKTRVMQGSRYSGVVQCIVATAKEGPMSFFKGFVPAWIRLSPQTILTWIFLEKLRKIFPAS